MSASSGSSAAGGGPWRPGPLRLSVARLSAVAGASLAAIVAVAGLGSAATPPTSEFTIAARVLAAPACTTEAVLLPGVERCIEYTVVNSDPDNRIEVTALRIASVTAPATCPADNLDTSRAAWAGSVVVPKGASAVVGTGILALRDIPANQDGCRGVTFGLVFSGTAVNAGTLPTPSPSGSLEPIQTQTPKPRPTPKVRPPVPPRPSVAPRPSATPRPRPSQQPRPHAGTPAPHALAPAPHSLVPRPTTSTLSSGAGTPITPASPWANPAMRAC